jgi:glutathione S-transferase
MGAPILYYAPRTRAFRVRWLLEELAVPYELRRIDLSRGEQRSPEYRAIHPLGAVPALVHDDGEISIESAAICLDLADRHPAAGLAPPPSSPLRARYYQWSVFAVATLDPIVAPAYARGFRWPEARRHEAATDDEHERFHRAVAALRPTLARSPWLIGENFGVADVLVGSVLAWADGVGLLGSTPELRPYLARLAERPAFERARAE